MDKSQIRFSRVTLTSLKIFKCSCMFPICLSDIQEMICVWSLTGWGRSACVILVSKGCDTVAAFMVLSWCPSILYKNMTLQRGHDLLHPFSPAVGKVSVNSSCESMSSSERALRFLWLSYFSDFVLSVKQMFLWGHFSAVEIKALTVVQATSLALWKWRVHNKRKRCQPYGCHQTTELCHTVWRHHKACDSFPPEEVFYAQCLPGFDVKRKLLFVPGSFDYEPWAHCALLELFCQLCSSNAV